MTKWTAGAWLAAALTAVVGVAGCADGLPGSVPSDLREPPAEESLPAPAEGLARFHEQELDLSLIHI